MGTVVDFDTLIPTEQVSEIKKVERVKNYNDKEEPWLFNGSSDFSIPEGHETFVYLITNKITNKKYIGFKTLVSKKIKVSKGKRHHLKIESNWKDYWSSSENLQKDIFTYGKGNFKREILAWTVNKGVGKYIELLLQMYFCVLTSNKNDYYNGIVNVRLGSKTVMKYDKVIWCDWLSSTIKL